MSDRIYVLTRGEYENNYNSLVTTSKDDVYKAYIEDCECYEEFETLEVWSGNKQIYEYYDGYYRRHQKKLSFDEFWDDIEYCIENYNN